MIDTACCLWRYFVCCCWWAIVCFISTNFMDTCKYWELWWLFVTRLCNLFLYLHCIFLCPLQKSPLLHWQLGQTNPQHSPGKAQFKSWSNDFQDIEMINSLVIGSRQILRVNESLTLHLWLRRCHTQACPPAPPWLAPEHNRWQRKDISKELPQDILAVSPLEEEGWPPLVVELDLPTLPGGKNK